jgi:hypothetical protein
MGISAQWDNEEKTVILVTFEAEWTWDDVIAIDAQATAMYDSVGHQVDLIADLRENKLVVSGILSYARSLLTTNWHPLVGIVIVVGISSQVRALFDAAAAVTGKRWERVRFVNSLEEARGLIAQNHANR